MKINGTIFSKPQQDQLKRGIGAELDKVIAKVDDVDKRMLNYKGDWIKGNEYHENDVVTWGSNGHLYMVIKAHKSSTTNSPNNPTYYKGMETTKIINSDYILAQVSLSSVISTIYQIANQGIPCDIAVVTQNNNAYSNMQISKLENSAITLSCLTEDDQIKIITLKLESNKPVANTLHVTTITASGITTTNDTPKQIFFNYLA